MDLKQLRNVGLTNGEIKVYEALLTLGESTKTLLAKTSGIAPSNIYDITNRLLEKGVIAKTEKNGVAHFSAANPQRLLDFLKKKEEDIAQEKTIISQLLPTLLLKFNEHKEKTQIETFYGWNGLKTVFEDLLEECTKEDENYIFGASKGINEKQADIIFIKYSRLRAQKGIKTKIIFNEEIKLQKERINFFSKAKNYEVRFLNQYTSTEIMLYKNKTCIIILTEQPLVIRITDQEVMRSFKQQFDILWKEAKE
ncbi:MAG: helix-turn-helix domain-containing protein [Nanoarchaeota archaeon]|nr:helix-turn-helix domain-containing protein [Nanoarchaeota archaeon]